MDIRSLLLSSYNCMFQNFFFLKAEYGSRKSRVERFLIILVIICIYSRKNIIKYKYELKMLIFNRVLSESWKK